MLAALGWFLLLGCGGGGGGSGDAGAVDPAAVEVRAFLDTFTAAIARNDLETAMGQVDSNLQYFRAGVTQPENHNRFRERLAAFVASAASITVQLDVSISAGEEVATARGSWRFEWRTPGGEMRSLTENVEIRCEKEGRWGIRTLSGHTLAGLQFPPE